MEYKSKYKAEETEAILDAKNNTGEAVDEILDGLFVDALQTKEVELSESAEITPDEGFLGLKKVTVTVKGGDAPTGGSSWKYYDISAFGDGIQQAAPMIIGLFHIMKCGGTHEGIYPCGVEISSSGLMYSMVAAGVDMSAPVYAAGYERIMTMEEYLSESSLWAQCFQMGMVEITKEQFYTI